MRQYLPMLPTAHNTTGDPPKKWISFTIGVWSNFESRYYDDGVLCELACILSVSERRGLEICAMAKKVGTFEVAFRGNLNTLT